MLTVLVLKVLKALTVLSLKVLTVLSLKLQSTAGDVRSDSAIIRLASEARNPGKREISTWHVLRNGLRTCLGNIRISSAGNSLTSCDS